MGKRRDGAAQMGTRERGERDARVWMMRGTGCADGFGQEGQCSCHCAVIDIKMGIAMYDCSNTRTWAGDCQ